MYDRRVYLAFRTINEMIGVLGHDIVSALQDYTGPGTTSTNEMNFVINHASCVGSILDLLTSSPRRYNCATDAAPLRRVNLLHQE